MAGKRYHNYVEITEKNLKIRPWEGKRRNGRRGKEWLRTAQRGSYTVEAVFLFPVILFLMAFILQLSIALYENVQQAAEDVEVLRQLDTGSMFLDTARLKAVKEQLTP